MARGPLDNKLSQLLCQQLYELRIDPDSVSAVSQPRLWRSMQWITRHAQALTVVAGGATLALITLLSVTLITLNLVPQSGSNSTLAQSVQTSVTVGSLTLNIGTPTDQQYGRGEANLALQLDLHNDGGTQTELRASDMLLVDSKGALFPPSWHNLDGKSIDGLADPDHVFVALDPNAAASLSLQFLVSSSGPFALRYRGLGHEVDTPLPTLTLTTQPGHLWFK